MQDTPPPHQATFTNDIQDTLSKAVEAAPSVETLYYAVISMANTDMKRKLLHLYLKVFLELILLT